MLRLMRRGLFKKLVLSSGSAMPAFFLMLIACEPFHSFVQLQSKMWEYYILNRHYWTSQVFTWID